MEASQKDCVTKLKKEEEQVLGNNADSSVEEATTSTGTVEESCMPPENRGEVILADNVNLKWVAWEGSIPKGAVFIWNENARRRDYVCSEAGPCIGFFTESRGPYCYYPLSDQVHRTTNFRMLVNEDNFELLEWKAGRHGSVPENSVPRASDVNDYVGRNIYGLGKVVPHLQAFFLPFNGKERCYKNYEVLTVNNDYHTQKLSVVQYFSDQAKFSSQPTGIVHKNLQTMKETDTVKETTFHKQKWDIGRPTESGVSSTITTKIPVINGKSISFLSEDKFQWHAEGVCTKCQEHPCPCKLSMTGMEYKAEMPYKAILARIYQNGKTRTTTIWGTFTDIQICDVVMSQG
uniref:Uncharacterized protein n=1 Tax=Sphenodon punctatus TaxID=8508 RepID=A0A8D0GTH8_SPHPU